MPVGKDRITSRQRTQTFAWTLRESLPHIKDCSLHMENGILRWPSDSSRISWSEEERSIMEESEPGGGDCTNKSDKMHYRVDLTLCFTHEHLQMPWKDTHAQGS
jgi:hypothetical protein